MPHLTVAEAAMCCSRLHTPDADCLADLQGATNNTAVAWYERMLTRHTESTSRGQQEAGISQSKAGLQGDAPVAQVMTQAFRT